jgi:preprotein translocase subunit YajC
MSFFIPSAMAAGDASPSSSGVFQILMFAGLFLLMYLIIIRPQRKRQKEHQSLIDSISKGNEVITSGGILGKVTKAEGDYILLQVSDNVELKIQKVSIHAVLPKGTIKSI